jgi:DnaJ-class molecular chaperone
MQRACKKCGGTGTYSHNDRVIGACYSCRGYGTQTRYNHHHYTTNTAKHATSAQTLSLFTTLRMDPS